MKTKSIMIVGVGGQGTLLASRLLGAVRSLPMSNTETRSIHPLCKKGRQILFLPLSSSKRRGGFPF